MGRITGCKGDSCVIDGIVYDTRKLQEEFKKKIYEILQNETTKPEMYKRLYDYAFGILQGSDIPFDKVYITIKKAVFYALAEMEEKL